MPQTNLIASAHSDLITCASYDWYGLRLATCGLDQRVYTNGSSSNSGIKLASTWKAHDAPLTHVCWAHPQFGQVIATAGIDGLVKIWERSTSQSTNGGWDEKAIFLDAAGSVRQIEFAPCSSGSASSSWLRLASVSTDGWLRVYECLDLGRMGDWALKEAVVLELNSTHGGWALSWCKDSSAEGGQLIAVVASAAEGGSGNKSGSGGVKNETPSTTTSTTITTVSWAPSCGRSYHLIATGGRDGHVRIYKVFGPSWDEGEPEEEKNRYSSTLVADFDDHATIGGQKSSTTIGGQVSKVEWNVTGTILASTGSDGRVRLWKAATGAGGGGGRVWRGVGSVGVEAK
ncbi:WD40-repeat-containing domain protein [Rhodocollybia butyracea]|uniref:WD40-repeat-containing domain protein n=1 Tax=Rhodocollybia butyracea TaxID=206335 RepID=A0A9P5UG94_9AGAR|nr:WD40-repeat-containing domain protein [Rhodocollybia butyracea]